MSGGAALWETAGDRTKAQRGPGSQGVPQPSTPWPDASLWLRTGLRGALPPASLPGVAQGVGHPLGNLEVIHRVEEGPRLAADSCP